MTSSSSKVGRPHADEFDGEAQTWTDTWREVRAVVEKLSPKKVQVFVGCLLLFSVAPSLASTFNVYYTVEMKFELATMSKLSLAMSIAYFLSIMTVNCIYKEHSFKEFYLCSGLLAAVSNLALLLVVFKFFNLFGMEAIVLCYFLNSLCTYMQELNFLPVLGACCRLCPQELETTSYGLFSSCFYAAAVVASLATAVLLKAVGMTSKKVDSMWAVVFVQAVFQLTVLLGMLKIDFPKPFTGSVMAIDHSKVPTIDAVEKDTVVNIDEGSPKEKSV